jgi:hypothetical protein
MNAIANRLTQITMIAATLAAAVVTGPICLAQPAAVRVVQLQPVTVIGKRIRVVELPTVTIVAKRATPEATVVAQRASHAATGRV